MPELPEVEITRQGIEPALVGRELSAVRVRQPSLRYPVPAAQLQSLLGQTVYAVRRRAKYLLMDFEQGSVLLHLGMSGSLRVVSSHALPEKHDHIDFVFGEWALRLRDPRRFGAVLWAAHPAEQHALLAPLGLEPLSAEFDGKALQGLCRGRRTPIKLLIMDGHRLVGVGNIYASESLFRARIHPQTPAGGLTLKACQRLALHIQETLQDALAAGGSSLRDFVHSDGSSGYFQQQYFVYGREAQPCRVCARPIQKLLMGQRASFFCPHCQPFSDARKV